MVALNSRPSQFLPSQFRLPPPPTDRDTLVAAVRHEAQYDAALVRRFQSGDDKSFTEIVTRHWPKIFAIAFARLRSRTDAEEIAQDTFIRAHRALASFRGESSLATWLYRIAINLSHNRYRYFARRARHLTDSLDWVGENEGSRSRADLVASDAPGPAHQAMTREFEEIATGQIKQLRPHHREILHQRNILNRPYDEIAAALGIRVATVKSRIARARKNLQTLMSTSYTEFASDATPAQWIGAMQPAGNTP